MDYIIIPDAIKITFNLYIESTDRAHSVVNNLIRVPVKEKVLMPGSTDIDSINNSDIYDTYKDFYLSEKKREDKLLQCIQSTNGLKARLGGKKADGNAPTLATQKNAIKKTFDKRFCNTVRF